MSKPPNSNAAPHQGHSLLARLPFRLLFRLAALIEALCIQLPLRAVLYILLPRLRPHPQWPLLKSLFVVLFKSFRTRFSFAHDRYAVSDKTILPRFSSWQDDARAVWIQPIDQKTDLQGDFKVLFEAGRCTSPRVLAYWFGKGYREETVRRAEKGEKVYLYFHGGGYWERTAHPSDPTSNCLRILLRASSKSSNKSAPKRGLSVDYRLTNETPFPGILADALAAWKYLIQQGFEPKNIVIGGDSAGGNLSLALTRYISEHRSLFDQLQQGEAVADALILFSPWVDVSLSYYEAGPFSSSVRNAATDYITPFALRTVSAALTRGLPEDAASNRLLSCINNTTDSSEELFDGFPRALVFGGSLEGLIDEIRALNEYYQKSAKAGRCGKMTFIEEPLGTHDWCAIPIGFGTDQKQTLEKVSKWI